MDKGPTSRDWAIVATLTFIAGFVVAGLLVGDAHGDAQPARSDWPAWVQAVGSVLAILAAIGIAMWQRHVERADRKAADASAARSLGVVVLREVRELRMRLHNVAGRVRVPYSEAQGKPIPTVHIPQALWDVAPALHTLGRPSDAITSALFHIQEARNLAEGPILWGENSAQYISHIGAAIAACDRAILQLRDDLTTVQ